MKSIIFSILSIFSAVTLFSMSADQCSQSKKYVFELGLNTPINASGIKDYINSNNVSVSPLTSGFNTGFQIGGHKIINDQATLGIVVGMNTFIASQSVTNQIYQLGTYLTGRLYFGDSWRNGIFTEISAGPEASVISLSKSDFSYQVNIASRLGVGYNYQFNKDVTLGVSVVISPSITSANYTDGAKIVVNMLW